MTTRNPINRKATFEAIAAKNMLNTDEASLYTGLSKSCLYKATAAGELPIYKPGGKIIFILKSDLDAWRQRNKRPSLII